MDRACCSHCSRASPLAAASPARVGALRHNRRQRWWRARVEAHCVPRLVRLGSPSASSSTRGHTRCMSLRSVPTRTSARVSRRCSSRAWRPGIFRRLTDTHCFNGSCTWTGGDCLPLRAGTDLRNGKELVFFPDLPGASFKYENVDESECCRLGAEPLKSRRDYLGCFPAKSGAAFPAFITTPEGKWLQFQNSPLPPIARSSSSRSGRAGRPYRYFRATTWACRPPLSFVAGLVRSTSASPSCSCSGERLPRRTSARRCV